MSQPASVILEITVWDEAKVQELIAKIESDSRVIAVRELSS